jgi:putative flippase GtrA
MFNIGRNVGFSVTLSLFIAFTFATLMSYVLNRRWSFQLNDSGENLTETWKFFAINAVAWAITEGLMRVAQAWLGPLSRIGENVALLVISGFILLPKFIGYREGVFGHALRDDAAESSPVA